MLGSCTPPCAGIAASATVIGIAHAVAPADLNTSRASPLVAALDCTLQTPFHC